MHFQTLIPYPSPSNFVASNAPPHTHPPVMGEGREYQYSSWLKISPLPRVCKREMDQEVRVNKFVAIHKGNDISSV